MYLDFDKITPRGSSTQASQSGDRTCVCCSWTLLFPPDSWPCGQVEECPSAEWWSVRPERSRLRPGRWPELLAPIRTRDPPHISTEHWHTDGPHHRAGRPEGQTEVKGRERTSARLQRTKTRKGTMCKGQTTDFQGLLTRIQGRCVNYDQVNSGTHSCYQFWLNAPACWILTVPIKMLHYCSYHSACFALIDNTFE